MPMSILVTGATGGIGRPLCIRLAKAGYGLVLASRDEARLEKLAAELTSSVPIHILPVDMSNKASVSAFGDSLAALNMALFSLDVSAF